MKKIISILLATAMLFAVSGSAFANGVGSLAAEKQDRIDAIFKELNELALEANVQNSRMLQKYGVSYSEEQTNARNERKANLERELELLGVHKIDPDCKEDLDRLGKVMLHAADASELKAGLRAAPSEDPPDLEVLTRDYSVYQYDKSIYVDQTYYGSYVVVLDDKGRGKLTINSAETDLCGTDSTILSDLLTYNFNFGLSQFLGLIPYGWAADWLIGNIFTSLDSYDESSVVTCGSKGAIYTIHLACVTQMTYTYIYDPGYTTWVLCGSRASNLSFSRADAFSANIGGRAVADAYTFPEVTSRTGESPEWYLLQYVNHREDNHHPIGSFTINGMNGVSEKVAPKYYSSPHFLM